MTNTNQTTQDCFDGSVAPYTPTQHAKVSPLKPVKLLALGTGEHGKTATFLFDGGWQREMDITGPVDAWHPLFMDLAYADSHALIEHAAIKTPLADGMVKVQDGPLSFVTETQTKRGKKLIFDYLDVPIEHYGPGRITGGKAALELVCCLKSGGGRGIDLPSIIQGASNAAVGSCLREASKRGDRKSVV